MNILTALMEAVVRVAIVVIVAASLKRFRRDPSAPATAMVIGSCCIGGSYLAIVLSGLFDTRTVMGSHGSMLIQGGWFIYTRILSAIGFSAFALGFALDSFAQKQR
jgi:hypothetical protein